MRYIALLVICSLSLWGATDAFTGADATDLTTHSASWVQNVNGFEIYSNELASKPLGSWAFAHWDATFANDQYAQAVIARLYEYDSQMGVAVRMHASAATCYSATWRENSLYLTRWVGGTGTGLGSYTGVAVSDTIRIEASGTSITVLKNSVAVIGPITDATIASGSPGVVGWSSVWSPPDASRANRLDTWAGDDLSAPPPGGGGTTTIITVCASGCDHTTIPAAIAVAVAANSGPQIIALKAGETFDTATGIALPARTGSYTGWITIRSSRIGELPAKMRVSPSDTTKMATVRVTSGGYTPVFYTSGHPSAYWRLEGLEITLSATGLNNFGWLVGIGYGTDEAETAPAKVSHHITIDRCYIHGLAFDNGPQHGIIANGDNVQILNSYISEIKRDNAESHGILGYTFTGPLLVKNNFIGGGAIGSMIGGSNTAHVNIQPNSVQFVGNHYQGTPTHRAVRYTADPQGTTVPSTCSTFTLYVDPAYQVSYQTFWDTDDSQFWVCTGSSGQTAWRKVADNITGNVCVDGDFWTNTMPNPDTYFLCSGGAWGSTGSDRTVTGAVVSPFNHFWSKNRFELKKVTGALVEGNLIERCFSPTDQQQGCAAILLNWVTDQDQPWSTLRDIRIQNNLIRQTAMFITEGMVASNPPERRASFLHRFPRNIKIDNNLVQDGNNPGIMGALYQLTMRYDNYPNPPLTTGLGGVGVALFGNTQFTHNTIINPLASTIFWPNMFVYSEQYVANRAISNNIFEIGDISAGVRWGGTGATGYGCLGFDSIVAPRTEPFWMNHTLKNNVLVNVSNSTGATTAADYDTADCRSWAFPWKRGGTGVRTATPTAGSIADGVLTIDFGSGGSSGLLQGTIIKLAGWSPTGLNTSYTIPRLGSAADGSSCATPVLTNQSHRYLCVATAATGAVTPGTIEASIDYENWAGLNFRLASTSAYKNWATDGADPGANQDTIEWATSTASSGVDNPYLDFRVRAIVPSTGGATFRYTAYSTATCTWLASTTRAFAASAGPFGSETRTGREGSVAITGLSNDTTYWYRVTCDSKTRDGQFTTSH